MPNSVIDKRDKRDKRDKQRQRSPGFGLGVDASGGPVVDPTANVIALNDASAIRQDDLREMFEKYVDMRFQYNEKIAELHSSHQREMNEKEASRLDSIRHIDIQNAAATATQALTAIQTLATTTAANAENIRAQVTSTATTIATQHAAMASRMEDRIAALERASYEGAGKERVADPIMADFMMEMKVNVASLVKTQAASQGSKSGINATWVWLLAAVTAIGTIAGITALVVTVIMFLTRSHP